MKVLVTGANGDIGEAVGRILGQEFPDATIVGADAAGRWPGGFVFGEVLQMPLASAPHYLDHLRGLARGFDLIVPTSEPEIARLAAAGAAARDLPILMVDANVVVTFMDKYDTAEFFTRHGIACPATRRLQESSADDLPLYVKPRRGAGGRGHRLVATLAEFRAIRDRTDGDWVAQEYLGGEDNEFTCALCRLNGEVRHITLRRKLQGDRTVMAEVVTIREIDSLLAKIASLVDLEGCINVQLKMTAAGPRVFEINPRLSSTVMMRHKLGFRDCAWWVRGYLGLPVSAYSAPPDGTLVYRISDERVVLGGTPTSSERAQ